MRRWLAAAALLLAGRAAQAAIVFTPHVSEYAPLARGVYVDTSLDYTHLTHAWNADGERIKLGGGAAAPGAAIDAALLLSRWLWIGNLFENTRIPWLATHDQVFRVIVTGGSQQGNAQVRDLSAQFGLDARGSGLGDLYLLAGVYGDRHHLGPWHANELFTLTVKAPVGQYDRRSLLNLGTHYWSVMPQLSQHQDWFGRLQLDATLALQLNGRNGAPAYGGLTPNRPADVVNAEGNLAWKFTEHWFAEAGFSWFRSLSSNRFEDVTLNLKDQPLPPTTACNALRIPARACSPLNLFYLAPVPGEYRDRGIENGFATLGFSYVHRASAVVSLRATLPMFGRGSEFDVPYYTCLTRNCNAQTQVPGAQQTARLIGVQEAAAVSASPYFELRVVWLPFAP